MSQFIDEILSSTITKSKQQGLFDPSLATVAQQAQLAQTALMWLSKHPELTPLATIMGQYLAAHAMNACLGPGMCSRCKHCLGLFGVQMHEANFTDLADTSLRCMYQTALRNPTLAIQFAQESIKFVVDAITRLSQLPDNLKEAHGELAELLFKQRSCAAQESPTSCSAKTLNDGIAIYNKRGNHWGEWLYVGLPEIWQQLGHAAVLGQHEVEQIIANQYNLWRKYGANELAKMKQNPLTRALVV